MFSSLFNNVCLMSDSYKVTHASQCPPDTTHIHSYLESRGGQFPTTCFFGLQYYLKRYLEGRRVSAEQINEASAHWSAHFGNSTLFHRAGWEHIVTARDGRLPVVIKAVPEGTSVPTSNVLMTIENTDPICYWLTNWLETLLVQVWYGTTVATLSRAMKALILSYLEETGTPADIGFKLHDFGFRGVSSPESAAVGGAAHLVNFKGTDTIVATLLARDYYGAKEMTAFSIPASEHSTITVWGKDRELAAYTNMLDQYPTGIVACVSDSYDIFNACRNLWGDALRDRVLSRNGTLVIRPDCYDSQTQALTPRGWVFLPEITEDDKVAQFTSDGETEFVSPTKRHEYEYDGEMVHFFDKKGRLDLLVTPNHRMVRVTPNNRVLDVQEAATVAYYHQFGMARAGFKIQGQKTEITPYERFLVAFQADGSYPSASRNYTGELAGHYRVRFNFVKQRKIDRLLKICDDANLAHHVHEEASRPGNKIIYVDCPEKPPKDFSWINIEEITGHWGRQFIEEVSYWDACRRTKTRFKIDTTNPLVADKVQQIASLSGVGCTYSVFADDRKEQFSDVHALTALMHKAHINGQAVRKEKVPFKGKVHCLTVPSGMLIVRRNRKVVVSGNSGDPPTMVAEVLSILCKQFGYSKNSKGYDVLPPQVRVIQGDGIDYESTKAVLAELKRRKLSADNVAFGMGGGLLQKLNRDTQRFAFKCSAAKVGGTWRDVYKEPVTDFGKRSKAGRLKLVLTNDGRLVTERIEASDSKDQLVEVFRDGVITKEWTFDQVRERAR